MSRTSCLSTSSLNIIQRINDNDRTNVEKKTCHFEQWWVLKKARLISIPHPKFVGPMHVFCNLKGTKNTEGWNIMKWKTFPMSCDVRNFKCLLKQWYIWKSFTMVFPDPRGPTMSTELLSPLIAVLLSSSIKCL